MQLTWPFSQSIIDLVNEVELKLPESKTHLSKILYGSVQMLGDITNPMRFSFAAHGFRELQREVLTHYGSDSEISSCSWFHSSKQNNDKPTRKDRIKFAIYGYVNPDHFTDDFLKDVDDLSKKIIETIRELSSYSHVRDDIIKKGASDAQELLESTLNLYFKMFEQIEFARESLIDKIQIEIADKLNMLFTDDFFDELDCLSTHTRPSYADVENICINDIDNNEILFSGNGTIFCNLQYGSDGDVKRGDGLEFAESFPFSFIGKADTETLKSVEVDKASISINTNESLE